MYPATKAIIMNTTALAVGLLLVSALHTAGQGVIVRPGESFAFGFQGMDNCQTLTERYPPNGIVSVRFGSDILAPGESLRLEMFENSLTQAPIASQTYSSLTPVTTIRLSRFFAWSDLQGFIRVTMIDGTVEVSDGRFSVYPDEFTFCETFVAVPEPSLVGLLAIGALGTAIVFFWPRCCS